MLASNDTPLIRIARRAQSSDVADCEATGTPKLLQPDKSASLSRFVRRNPPPVDAWKYIGSGLIRLKESCFRVGPSQPQVIGRHSKMELISLGRHVGC